MEDRLRFLQKMYNYVLILLQCKIIELYTTSRVDILLWNYRGYGYSTGSPSYESIKKDAELVIQFAKKQNRWNKIGVHGLSIGGIGACHLAG